jgi:hypothetical protein
MTLFGEKGKRNQGRGKKKIVSTVDRCIMVAAAGTGGELLR